MSRRTRALVVGAILAATNLAASVRAMTAVLGLDPRNRSTTIMSAGHLVAAYRYPEVLSTARPGFSAERFLNGEGNTLYLCASARHQRLLAPLIVAIVSAVLEQAKGYYGNRSRSYKSANEAVLHSLDYQYRDRRNKKRDFHRLWIIRINAAARQNGLSYSRLMAGLRAAGVEINRKMLAEMAVSDSASFTSLVALARDSQASGAVATA